MSCVLKWRCSPLWSTYSLLHRRLILFCHVDKIYKIFVAVIVVTGTFQALPYICCIIKIWPLKENVWERWMNSHHVWPVITYEGGASLIDEIIISFGPPTKEIRTLVTNSYNIVNRDWLSSAVDLNYSQWKHSTAQPVNQFDPFSTFVGVSKMSLYLGIVIYAVALIPSPAWSKSLFFLPSSPTKSLQAYDVRKYKSVDCVHHTSHCQPHFCFTTNIKIEFLWFCVIGSLPNENHKEY